MLVVFGVRCVAVTGLVATGGVENNDHRFECVYRVHDERSYCFVVYSDQKKKRSPKCYFGYNVIYPRIRCDIVRVTGVLCQKKKKKKRTPKSYFGYSVIGSI